MVDSFPELRSILGAKLLNPLRNGYGHVRTFDPVAIGIRGPD